MTSPIVSVHGLKKRFGPNEILHGLDFEIPSGRIYGLIGHNGAGKTTTLNAMLGLTSYEGSVQVLGEDPYKHRARLMRHVAFISDVASLPRFLKVRELFAMLSDIHPNFSAERAMSFLEGTDVKPGALIANLSKGMLAQLHLAVVMAIDARLLVLDEPTLGLDIIYRKKFYDTLLNDYFDGNRTILVTTHQVEEIEQVLTDVMFIDHGRIVLDCSMDEVANRYVELFAAADQTENARKLNPISERQVFGRSVMLFEQVERDKLAQLGETRTPSIADLFVAKLSGNTSPNEKVAA